MIGKCWDGGVQGYRMEVGVGTRMDSKSGQALRCLSGVLCVFEYFPSFSRCQFHGY